MIVISSKGKISREEARVLIMVGDKVIGSIPKSPLMGDVIVVKDLKTFDATTSVYDGEQWQQI